MDISKVPLEPIDQWYLKFLSWVKKEFGENWREIEMPPDIQEGLLKIHQEATWVYWQRKQREKAEGTKGRKKKSYTVSGPGVVG